MAEVTIKKLKIKFGYWNQNGSLEIFVQAQEGSAHNNVLVTALTLPTINWLRETWKAIYNENIKQI